MSQTELVKIEGKKGGPYSAKERRIRREQVAELFIDKGFSALTISRILNVNRNTVTNDLKFCYEKLAEEYDNFDLNTKYMTQMLRMEIQRRRFVDLLGKQISFKERLVLERMISDIDYKMIQSVSRINTTQEEVQNLAVELFNGWAKNQKPSYQGIPFKKIMRASTQAQEKIDKIIDEDRKKSNGFDV